MQGTSRLVAAFAILWVASACGTGNTSVDPGDLELRDLLGVAPEVATTWDAEQRSSARHVVADALDDEQPAHSIEIESYRSDEQVVRALTLVDGRRFDEGDDALGFIRVSGSRVAPLPVELSADAKIVDALAAAAGHDGTELVVVREPRLTVAAAYIEATPPRLLVNPIVLEAFGESDASYSTNVKTSAGGDGRGPAATPSKPTVIAANGNPYSFYGSIAECAYAQRLRCEACLPNSSCTEAITSSTGMEECTKLAENDGRGYFLLCINLAVAITSVQDCTANAVSSCTQNTTAANNLGQLEANATFLTDTSCASGLDGCLASIYGNPGGTFPGLMDGGVSPPPTPPRDPEVSCGDGCSSDNNSNCEASPNCSCDGPSCNNSLSCDSTCASSNDQSGCGGGCDSCESEGGGSTGGGGCGGSSSSGGSSGGGCGGDSGGCGGCSSSSSSSGGSSGGGCDGGCGGGGGGGSCGGDSGGGSCGGGGGGGCQVAKKEPSAAFAVAFSLAWAFLPIPVAAMIRRRSRKQKKTKEVQP